MLWDNLNAEWNDWVVQFDRAAQEASSRQFGFEDPDWRAFAAALAVGLAIAVGILRAVARARAAPAPADPARPPTAASSIGSRGAASSGPVPRRHAISRSACAACAPTSALSALAITETYLRLRYGPAPAAGDLRLLRALVTRYRP